MINWKSDSTQELTIQRTWDPHANAIDLEDPVSYLSVLMHNSLEREHDYALTIFLEEPRMGAVWLHVYISCFIFIEIKGIYFSFIKQSIKSVGQTRLKKF